MTIFKLDHRLKNDCIEIGEMRLCRILLMDDQRWPWIVLVPRKLDVCEIHDLEDADQVLLHSETKRIAQALGAITECEKINSGALGNIVRQLHIHVVARNIDDANWPGPVWGFEKRIPYQGNNAKILATNIQHRLALHEEFL